MIVMLMSSGKGQCKTVIIETNTHMANNRFQWLSVLWEHDVNTRVGSHVRVFTKGLSLGLTVLFCSATDTFFFPPLCPTPTGAGPLAKWATGHGKKDIIRERRCLKT